MNIEKQERINTNIKTRSKNEKVSIKISFSSSNCSSNDELYNNSKRTNKKHKVHLRSEWHKHNRVHTEWRRQNIDTQTEVSQYLYPYAPTPATYRKSSYRWDAYRELWKPAYLLTVTPGVYEIKLNYAEWNAKESTFNHNKQESIYREGNNANLLADTQNKK